MKVDEEDQRQHLKGIYHNIPKRKKHLVVGFQGYLIGFEAMMQKIAGNDMFLPESLRRETNKKAYEELRNVLRINISP